MEESITHKTQIEEVCNVLLPTSRMWHVVAKVHKPLEKNACVDLREQKAHTYSHTHIYIHTCIHMYVCKVNFLFFLLQSTMDTLIQQTFSTFTHTHTHTHTGEQIIFIELAIAVFSTYTHTHIKWTLYSNYFYHVG